MKEKEKGPAPSFFPPATLFFFPSLAVWLFFERRLSYAEALFPFLSFFISNLLSPFLSFLLSFILVYVFSCLFAFFFLSLISIGTLYLIQFVYLWLFFCSLTFGSTVCVYVFFRPPSWSPALSKRHPCCLCLSITVHLALCITSAASLIIVAVIVSHENLIAEVMGKQQQCLICHPGRGIGLSV